MNNGYFNFRNSYLVEILEVIKYVLESNDFD